MAESTIRFFASALSADGGLKNIGLGAAALPAWKGRAFAILRGALFFMPGQALLTALLYYLGAKVGFLLTFQPHPVSILWPTNAILTAMLLLTPGRRGWWMLAAAFPAHLVVELGSGVPISMVLCWFVSNCTEAVVAAACVRRFAGYPVRFDSFRGMASFIVAGALAAPFVASFLDAGFVTLIGWGADNYWQVWRMRFLSNVLAMLTIVPVMVIAGSQSIDNLRKLPVKRVIEGFLLTVGVLVVGELVFWEDNLPVSIVPVLVYMPLPFLLWAAVRFGPAGLGSLILLTVLLTIRGAINGFGPFSHITAQHVVSLQMFLILMSVPLMLMSAIMQERQNAGQALNESESRFRIALDAAPVMLWMSGADKRCTFFNKGWLEFAGRESDSELGNGCAQGVHPDDLQSCLETYATSFDQRKPFRMEYRLRRLNGEYRWILDVGVPRHSADGAFRGYIGIARDITERKETEAELGQSEKRYREVVESQTDLICRYLPNTTITFVNEAYCRFFGKRREELIGHSFFQLLPQEQHPGALKRIVSMVQYPKTLTFERKTAAANGAEKWHQWIVYPAFDDGGHVLEFQAIARDITERRRAEESLHATHQQVNALAHRLIHAEEEVRRRIARELHDDFNQRLAAHAIALSNFEHTVVSGDGALLEKLKKLQDEAVSLSDDVRLIAHELHPSWIEHAGFESTLRSFCGEFSSLTRLQIDLHVDVKRTLPADVALCCYRILQESLRNIAKHARALRVQVRVQHAAGRLVLLVADDGAGVEEQQLKAARGLGITSMEERIQFLSGEFHINKRKTGGTLIAVEVPIT